MTDENPLSTAEKPTRLVRVGTQSESLVRQARASAEAVLEADEDNSLTFDEFVAQLPTQVRKMRKTSEFRSWFDMLDKDGSGSVNMEEFFVWSVSASSIASGSGAKRVFQRFDQDRSGVLDLAEFTNAAQSLGFDSEHAHDLFDELDSQSDGVINYLELLEQCNKLAACRASGDGSTGDVFSAKMREFLLAMSWDTAKDSEVVDTSDWSFNASTTAGVKKELVALLTFHAVRLSHIFSQADVNEDFSVSYGEFLNLMEDVIGFRGARAVLNDVWLELDDDDSGVVSFEELDGWIFGRPVGPSKRLEAVRELSLRGRVREGDAPWSVHRLRDEVRAMIEEADVRANDLLDAWDVDGDHRLRKREWLMHFKKLVDDEDVWYSTVRCAVDEAFEHLDAMDPDKARPKQISIAELGKWLSVKKTAAKSPKPLDLKAVASPRTHSPACSPSPGAVAGFGRRHPALAPAELAPAPAATQVSFISPVMTPSSPSPGSPPSPRFIPPGSRGGRLGRTPEHAIPRPGWRPTGGKGRPIWPLEVNSLVTLEHAAQRERRVLANLAAKSARVPAPPSRADGSYLRFNKGGRDRSPTDAADSHGQYFISRKLNWPMNGVAYRRAPAAPAASSRPSSARSRRPSREAHHHLKPAVDVVAVTGMMSHVTTSHRTPTAPKAPSSAASKGSATPASPAPSAASVKTAVALVRLDSLLRDGGDPVQVAWPVANRSPRKGWVERGSPLK